MSTFKSCAIVLHENKKVYRKGEQVTGTLVLDVNEDVVVKRVLVRLYGESLVRWSPLNYKKRDYIAKEKYIQLVVPVFGNNENESGPNPTLTSGRHIYNFRFNLPTSGLPSSYEGVLGGIRYWLTAEVDRLLNSNHYCITVLDDIDVNDAQYKAQVRSQNTKQVSTALGIGNAGTLTLTSTTDRGAYCAGEKIALSVVATNESTKNLGKLIADLTQIVVFTVGNDTKTSQTVIRSWEGSPLLKGEERIWKDQLLEIDAIPPSTTPRSCHIITVSYYIKVFVEVPLGFNLETLVPITIGTIPYSHSTSTPRGATASGLEVDVSSAITYTQCSRGFQRCGESNRNFASCSYTPMCAYVPNYVFPPRQPLLPTAPGSPSTTDLASGSTTRPASPVSVSPPSYEAVLKMDKPAATKEVAVVKPDKPYGLLLLRFRDSHIQDFRDTIERESQSLTDCDGEVIAMAPQPIFKPEQWPARTSVAILKFPSVEAASDWFSKTPGVADPTWLGSCDAMISTMIEQFRDGYPVFTMTKYKLKDGVPGEKLQMFEKLYPKTLRTLRSLKTGVRLMNGKQYTTLRGRWLDGGWSLLITQWESFEKYFEYKREKELDQYRKISDLQRELYEKRPNVMFQSEDLSPCQVTNLESVEKFENPALEIQAEKEASPGQFEALRDQNEVRKDEIETEEV